MVVHRTRTARVIVSYGNRIINKFRVDNLRLPMLIEITIGRNMDDVFQKRLERDQISRILDCVFILKSSYYRKVFSVRPKSFVFAVEFLMPRTVKSVLGCLEDFLRFDIFF